ncbi:type I 3-dehydroquinate dehydratase [Halobaculum sp. CBA1158]|uniref:type I 3-dehydroquinate dehydratase n=1 Tax=Halobaculum sp. CBA1158 TaxID=2904243 RepID=UPI001F2A903C|nr:type I 3-dehydroquinate dehydratase [Halobaculum sp. CBA1158]UIP01240.1 type I 3-dehydroquinate dehydratase [Halobaculum sp. CBA1158]
MFGSFSLAAATADLAEEPAAREHADCLEFRMDLADEPLAALSAYDGELPLLVTNRPRWEGGDTAPYGRLDALAEAVDHDAVAAVDVELATLRGRPTGTNEVTPTELVERARAADAAVVASVHDFDGTPAPAALDGLLRAAAAAGDVGKLAVTARTREDALALLSATHRATNRGDRVATMAMGEAGSHTRAVAPVYGSLIGYAPVDPADATAPGQYDLATMRRLVDDLL